MSPEELQLLEVIGSWVGSIGICGGTVFVGLQLKIANEQQKLANEQQKIANEQEKTKSLVKYFDSNRELIMAGFTHPELFQVLNGEEVDPEKARRCFQLWFNHFAVVHRFEQDKSFPADELESLKRDIRASMKKSNMRNHWEQNREFYTESFQGFIDQLLPPEQQKKADALEERPPRKTMPLTDS